MHNLIIFNNIENIEKQTENQHSLKKDRTETDEHNNCFC